MNDVLIDNLIIKDTQINNVKEHKFKMYNIEDNSDESMHQYY